MLSGEGKENGEKTKVGLISKKATLHVLAHFLCTFLCLFFARLQRETSRSFLVTRFMEKMSYMFLFTCFPQSLIFTQATVSISHFLTAATKLHVVPPTKNVSFVFSISLQLFFSFSFAGPSPYFLFFSVLLFLYFPNLWS